MEVTRQLSDTEILHHLKAGTRMNECIQFIYRNHFASLSWFIMNNSGSRQDAEDIFQETIINFIESVQKNKFRGEAGIKTFLFSLNRNAWLNELKRRGRAMQRELKYENEQDKQQTDAAHALVDREERKQVITLVEQLGENCKKILLLFYYENMPMKEILDQLEYENEQVVRNKKYKCLKQLEQMIEANPALQQTLKNLLHG